MQSHNKTQPIFQKIFGDKWDKLPPVFHKHYPNHPFTHDRAVAVGKISVFCPIYLKPFLKLLGAMPPDTQDNIDITVYFSSNLYENNFDLKRIFSYSPDKNYVFHSSMYPLGGNEIAERMSFGISWHADYDFDGKYVTLTHKKYSIFLFGKYITLPISWLIGKGTAKEWAINEDEFSMEMQIIHPIFGKIYEYKGDFKMVTDSLEK